MKNRKTPEEKKREIDDYVEYQHDSQIIPRLRLWLPSVGKSPPPTVLDLGQTGPMSALQMEHRQDIWVNHGILSLGTNIRNKTVVGHRIKNVKIASF